MNNMKRKMLIDREELHIENMMRQLLMTARKQRSLKMAKAMCVEAANLARDARWNLNANVLHPISKMHDAAVEVVEYGNDMRSVRLFLTSHDNWHGRN